MSCTTELGHNMPVMKSKDGTAVTEDPTPVDPTHFSIQPNLSLNQAFPIKTEEIDDRIKFRLTNEALWDNFHKHTTEMIVTKAGRKMFPKFEFTIDGLDPKGWYGIYLTMVPKDQNRYKFQAGEWSAVGQADVRPPAMPVIHENGFIVGNVWMSNPICYDRIKLTNLPQSDQTNKYLISLASMHKYQPTISVYLMNQSPHYHYKLVATWAPKTAEFIAVTAYQNQNVTKLKINNNPFAKGFREGSIRKRSHSSSPDPDEKDPKRLALVTDIRKPIYPLSAHLPHWNNFAALHAAGFSGLYHAGMSPAVPQLPTSVAPMVPTSMAPYWHFYNPMLAAVTHPSSMSMSI
uniref:T-box domain-containing protein n=1 Tax=Acrobeloides nanus TaxID=290746 RepID=A0A914D2V9_9BILA